MNLKNFKWVELFHKAKINKPIYYALSGSHLYGFPSKDSDIDIRGCHSEPKHLILGLSGYHEVRKHTEGALDFESFDLKKELSLVLANNSNVLEHLAAPPAYKSKHYAELRGIAEKSLSKVVAKPYSGMAMFNYQKYLRSFNESYREAPVKKYLYVIRAYMAGIYALGKRRIEPNIVKLNKMRMFRIPIVDELVRLKKSGKKKEFLQGCREADEAIDELGKRFSLAEQSSILPPTPNTFYEANEFLLKIRDGME